MKFDHSTTVGSSEANLCIRGSQNGLLRLLEFRSKLYHALFICNPITREYIAFPRIEGIVEDPDISEYGFGLSKISGQYKVVRIVHRRSYDHVAGAFSNIQNHECLVYTVGTRSWRNIQPGVPSGESHHSFGLLMNGNLHGLVQDCRNSTNMSISCLDLEAELFKPFPPTPPPINTPAVGSLGILDDCLYFLDSSSQDADVVNIWVMKEYGLEESWTKKFAIEGQRFDRLLYYSLEPIKVFKDGDMLLRYENLTLFYFNNKTKTHQRLDHLVVWNYHDWIEAMPHSSSFLSLKSFDGENVISF